MKMRQFLFAFLLSLTAFQFCFSQEKPKAILFDKFGNISCEELLARMDNFFAEVDNETDSIGYAVIYGEKNELMKNLRYESWIKGYTNFRNFYKDRLVIIRGKEQENFNIELWKMPKDAEKPLFIETKWSYILPKSTKPFIFTAYTYGDGLCPSTSYVKLYADFLLANPKARGHLVIRDKTSRNFRSKEKEILDELVNRYKIPRNRLKLFYVRDKDYPYNYTDVEFWFVP